MKMEDCPEETQSIVIGKPIDDIKSKSALAKTYTRWRAVLAELVSTTLLLLAGCMTCVPIDGFPKNPPTYGPLGWGLAVLFNVQIFGHLSGAHMNPAVTLAAVLWGKTTVTTGIAYIGAQCVGAILGYGILFAVAPMDLSVEGVCVTGLHRNLTAYQGFVIELFLTSLLIFLCCSFWDPENEKKTESLAIKFGLTIAGLSLAGGPLTGASMNPARSLGPAVWTNRWNAHWIYWLGPLLSSVIVTMCYRTLWLKTEEPIKKRYLVKTTPWELKSVLEEENYI